MFVIHIQTSVTDIQTLVTICYRQNQHETPETKFDLRVQIKYPLQSFFNTGLSGFPTGTRLGVTRLGVRYTAYISVPDTISLHREHASVFKNGD